MGDRRAATTEARSVRARLRRAFGLLVLLLVATGLLGLAAVVTVDRSMQRLRERDSPALAANAAVLQHMTDAETSERGYLLTGDTTFLEPYQRGRRSFGAAQAEVRRLSAGDGPLLEAIDLQGVRARSWLDGFADPAIEVRRDDAEAAIALSRSGEGRRRFDRFRRANRAATELLEARRDDDAARATRVATTAGVLTALLVAAGSTLGAVVASSTTSAVTGPLRRLRRTLAELAGGDLSQRAEEAGPEEIRAVARSVNQLAGANEDLMARRAQVEEAQRSALDRERQLVEQLQALDLTRQELVASVSHELRTPLTSISGYLELLDDEDTGPLTDEQRRILDVVERNAARLLALVEEILTLSRIDAGTYQLDLARTELAPLVAAAEEAMLVAAGARGVTLTTEVATDLPALAADPAQLERVLLNLVSNAVKFTPPGGEVTIAARRRDAAVEVLVADTGMGIPADEQPLLFSPFFRSSTARRQQIQGTGLGLAIVHAIVERHGGSIAIASLEGLGTTVRITLPVPRDDAPEPTRRDRRVLALHQKES